MKQYEFEKALNQNRDFNSALLYGQSNYLIAKYSKKLASKYDGADICRVYFDEYNFSAAKNFLAQSSLFGDKLIYWLMTDKKIDKKEADELIAIAKKNDGLFLVQFLGDLSGKDSSFVNAFSEKNGACEVRFFASSRVEDSIRLLLEEARDVGVEIDHNALDELLKMQNGDLELAASELGKFVPLGRKVHITDIRDTAGENDQTEMDSLIEDIFNFENFAITVERLLEKSGFDEIRIILNLEYLIYDYYKIILHSKSGLSVSAKDIKNINVPDFIWQNSVNRAIKIRYQTYVKLFDILMNAEFDLKTMKGNEARLILLSALTRFQAALKM